MTESMRSRGMRDVLPPDTERFRRIETAFREACLGWGYGEVRTPAIEHLYLFTSAGRLSPQMLDRVYSFLDWDGWTGERVVLRPDSTIPTVRLFAENMADRDEARLFYVQNVFRFEQGDADREDWQCGVELLGDTFPHGDIELILMARETLERLGLAPQVKLSHPGIVRAVLDAAGLSLAEQLALYDRVLEGDTSALGELGDRLTGASSVSAVLAVEGDGPDYLRNLETVLAASVPGAAGPLAELSAVSGMLAGMGLAHKIAPVLVRRFEYYTGPVFHLFAEERKVGGGGRYDALAGLVGDRDLPASGFALEVDQIMPLLATTEEATRSVTILCESRADLGRAFALAVALRQGRESVQITTRPVDTMPTVAVSGDGFALSVNGGSPQKLREIDEVVRAVARR